MSKIETLLAWGEILAALIAIATVLTGRYDIAATFFAQAVWLHLLRQEQRENR